MYSNIEIANFRCFKKLKIDGFNRVNLIAGKNGSGKTSLLEAIFLHAGAYNPELTFTINALRGIDRIKIERGAWAETPFDLIFRDFNSKEKIEIKATFFPSGKRTLALKVLRGEEELRQLSRNVAQSDSPRTGITSTMETDQVLELEYQENRSKRGKFYLIASQRGANVTPLPPPPPFPCRITSDRYSISKSDFAESFGEIEKQGKKQEIIDILRIVEPRIKDLSMIINAEKPQLHANMGLSRLMPMSMMGGGVARLCVFSVFLLLAPNGVVLFDEIDNGMHHSILKDLWKIIGAAARRNNTQVFATTHSLECIHAAHKAFSTPKTKYDFRLHRLDQKKEDIIAVTYDQEALEGSIDINLEVR